MAAASEPYESYLKRAADLFEAGDIVQAGQIWQAILKKRPDHEAARAGLYKVKLYFDARATQGGLVKPELAADARATGSAAPKSQDPEILRLLEQGCTLYDAGHVEDALTKWAMVLAKEPDNILAKGYINGARRTLGQLPPEAVAAPAAPVPSPAPAPTLREPEVDLERLLRDGCTLFDMGQTEDALRKWEQILAHDPSHSLARAYVQDARKDLGLPPLEEGARPVLNAIPADPVLPPTSSTATAQDERLEQLIRDGVQLYDMGMLQEATEKWHQVLNLAPGHQEALDYLAMAKRDQAGIAPTSISSSGPNAGSVPQPKAVPIPVQPRPQVTPTQIALMESTLAPSVTVPEAPAHPVTPPASLTTGAQKARKGFNLPDALQGISLPPWMASPAFILGTITGLVVLVVGSYYYLLHRKDAALQQAVAAFRASATAPVARSSEIQNLQESPAEIQRQTKSALGADPLMAYFRAQELVRLSPTDAAAAQLLTQAKEQLGKVVEAPATLADFEKQLQNGQLETADHSIRFLLSQNPDDRILRERAGRLCMALAQDYALKEDWSDAEDQLRLGRALFPEDHSWSVKLLLLPRIQSMGKKDRTPWIQLLG
jgi:tetratricopeptide (TPR) repeat protein